ncbi:MAG: ExbD/TolR family protein [Bacteriovoracaceae bacterium]
MSLHRKKDLNAELILTPFIDLLSTCVCFLLISAVWIQVATVDIKQTHGTEAAPSKKESYEVALNYKKIDRLQVVLKKNGKRFRRTLVKAKDHDEVVEKLKGVITSWTQGKKAKKIESAFVSPIRALDYGEMIKALDVLRENKILNIGIVSGR